METNDHTAHPSFDHDLLISDCNGLGAFFVDAEGRKVYVKDEDCLGMMLSLCTPSQDIRV